MPKGILPCGSLLVTVSAKLCGSEAILSDKFLRHAKSKHERRTVRRILTNPEDASLMEILDRVLDRGIVLDPSTRVRLIGNDLRNLHDRLVIDWRKTQF